jgi:asparagine synthase (glutamine-hydrolysing)
MEKQGYEVRCLIAIKPENKDSFMFHTPTIELAKLQAKSLGKRLLLVHTKGEKEKEVEELEKGLMLAKKMFKIEGICSGALYSNYQRERIERACEKHGLRHFAPLWHLDQEKYLKQVIASGFEIIITKIACYGMSEKWLGRKIDSQAIYELIQLNKKYGINVAGEGGEYETLVLDTPRFKDKIFVEFIVKMTNENTGEIELKKIELKRKN